MPFSAATEIDEFLRNLKSRRFSMAVSRANLTGFEPIGLIEVNSVSLTDLRTENKVQGGSLQGYRFEMTVTIPNMSVFAGNQYVSDREELGKGRWFVSLMDIETQWIRITPFPVALDIIERDFTGTQISFALQTSDIEWIKHQSPTAPLVLSPIILLDTDNTPVLPSKANPLSFNFQLSNPTISPVIENLVVYDILVYSDAARTTLVAKVQNRTKAQIIDNPTPSSLLDAPLQKGRLYYAIARCRLATAAADTPFRFVIALDAPSFDTPTPEDGSVISFTSTLVTIRVQRGASNEMATNCELQVTHNAVEETPTSIAPYNSISGDATFLRTLNAITHEGTYNLQARSRNNNVIGAWSAVRTFQAQAFRQLPSILSFSADRTLIAKGDSTLSTQQVRFSYTVQSNDVYCGALVVQLIRQRVTAHGTVQHMINAHPFTPTTAPQSASFVTTVSGNDIINGDQFFVRVININNQQVNSAFITIQTLDLPDASNLHAQLTSREHVYNIFNNPASPGEAVARWQKNLGSASSYQVEQSDGGKQPILEVDSQGVRYLRFPSDLSYLEQLPSQISMPAGGDGRTDEFTIYIAVALTDLSPSRAHSACFAKVAGASNISLRHNELFTRRQGGGEPQEVKYHPFSGFSANMFRVVVYRLKRNSGGSGSLILSAGHHLSGTIGSSTYSPFINHPITDRLVINGTRWFDDGRPIPTNPSYLNSRYYEILIYQGYHSDAVINDVFRWLLAANLK